MLKTTYKKSPESPGKRRVQYIGASLMAAVLLMLAGCDSGAISPKGLIATEELKLSIFAIELMLIVVIPVIFMAFWFGWRYREGRNGKYSPEWCHSTILELIWWSIPITIIAILGTATWKTTHDLDPYKPLVSEKKPVKVEVISLDWKWLFIYPEYQIATINYMKLPVNTPVDFRITAASPMNSFIIPQLGGQIYAMTGMKTELHLIADALGDYRGLATNYTGIGFSEMNFNTEVVSDEAFADWVSSVKKTSEKLSSSIFWDQLVPPSIKVPTKDFGDVEPGLFDGVVMRYMMPHEAHHVMHEAH